jgi:cytochrome P450
LTGSRLTTGLDQHSAEYAQHGLEIEADLRQRCPVSWSSNHGGFWAIASHSTLSQTLRDRDLCSSRKEFDENGARGGLMIPSNTGYRMVPDETDPPEWQDYRAILNPPFAPPAIPKLEPKIQAITSEVINAVIERGTVDLVRGIASPVTAITTLEILDLPFEDWKFYAETIHKTPYDGRNPVVKAGVAAIYAKIRRTVSERKVSPGNGLIDYLIRARVGGEPFPDNIIGDMIYQLLVGGFDTTGALLANAFWYLDDHRDEHKRLITDEKFLQTATEEFLRWGSPVIALGRTAKVEMELQGQRIEAGERMWMMYRSANHDPEVFENPEQVDLSRFPNRHVGFGMGIHRCPGSKLARAVFRAVVRQVLARMPDFAIDREESRRYPALPTVNGFITLPARFTPGPTVDSGFASGLPL